MEEVAGVNNIQNYLDLVQQATRRNTFTLVADAVSSNIPVDREALVRQVQLSNQELRDNARETGVELYGLNMQRQAYETYINASQNSSNTTNDDSDTSNSDVYQLNAEQVNETLQTAQRREFVSEFYNNQTTNNASDSQLGLVSNVYV